MGFGHNRITLKIADTVFGIESERADCSVHLTESFRSFLCSSEPEITITVSSEPIPAMIPLERHRIFEAWDRWSLYRIDDRDLLVERDSFSSAIPQRVLIFDPTSLRGTFFFRCSDEPWSADSSAPNPLDYPLGHVLIICLLARKRGLMVHGCGIDDQGRGYLFPGNSGHGKSTMAGLWEGKGRVLSDESVVLVEGNGHIRMYGTPWHGSYNAVSPEGVTVEKIFFLRHGEQNGALPIMGAAASAMILARSFPPIWDGNGMSSTLNFLANLCDQAQCYQLAFRPDESVIPFVRCVR
jgi:hypothetical protein